MHKVISNSPKKPRYDEDTTSDSSNLEATEVHEVRYYNRGAIFNITLPHICTSCVAHNCVAEDDATENCSLPCYAHIGADKIAKRVPFPDATKKTKGTDPLSNVVSDPVCDTPTTSPHSCGTSPTDTVHSKKLDSKDGHAIHCCCKIG